ncbi:MAG: transposase [Burkholderiaceae bacterium]
MTGGSLTCDDFSGYKALIASGVTEVGCWHARRKFADLRSDRARSPSSALHQFARVYRSARVRALQTDQRQAIRQQQTKPLLDALHQWMLLPEGAKVRQAPRRWTSLRRWAR